MLLYKFKLFIILTVSSVFGYTRLNVTSFYLARSLTSNKFQASILANAETNCRTSNEETPEREPQIIAIANGIGQKVRGKHIPSRNNLRKWNAKLETSEPRTPSHTLPSDTVYLFNNATQTGIVNGNQRASERANTTEQKKNWYY